MDVKWLKVQMDKLRAEASRGGISSSTVFSMTDPVMDMIARNEEDDGHVWHDRVFESMNVRCCMNCGFIKNEHKPNKPCPGPIGVTLRDSTQ